MRTLIALLVVLVQMPVMAGETSKGDVHEVLVVTRQSASYTEIPVEADKESISEENQRNIKKELDESLSELSSIDLSLSLHQ